MELYENKKMVTVVQCVYICIASGLQYAVCMLFATLTFLLSIFSAYGQQEEYPLLTFDTAVTYQEALFKSILTLSFALFIIYTVIKVLDSAEYRLSDIGPLPIFITRVFVGLAIYLYAYFISAKGITFLSDGSLFNVMEFMIAFYIIYLMAKVYLNGYMDYNKSFQLGDYIRSLEDDTLVEVVINNLAMGVYQAKELLNKDDSILSRYITPSSVSIHRETGADCIADDSILRSDVFDILRDATVAYLVIDIPSSHNEKKHGFGVLSRRFSLKKRSDHDDKDADTSADISAADSENIK